MEHLSTEFASAPCGNIFMAQPVTYGMANFVLEIGKYRKLEERAREAGHPELAEVAKGLVKSYEERSNDPRD